MSRYALRRSAFLIVWGTLGCATVERAPAPPKPPAPADPAKQEVVVFGRAPPPMGGIKPQDEGTEFVVYHGRTLRCTKVKPSAKNPSGLEYCRDIGRVDSRNPDPGRAERSETQGTWR